MFIYIIMTVLAMICAGYAQNVKGMKQLAGTYKILTVLSVLPFLFVSVFRYEVGTDWPIYDDYFHRIGKGTDRFAEPGFNLLNRILYLFSKDSWILFAVVAVLIGVFTFKAIYEQSVNIPFSILIFVLNGDFFNSQNQLRQALALAVFLYAMKYIWKRDLKSYIAWMLAAVSVHIVAVLLIPLYFLYGRKINLKVQGLLFCILPAVLPAVQKILIFLVAKTKYGWYFESIYNQNNFYLIGLLFSVFFLVLYFYYYYYGRNEEDYQYNFMVNMYYLATLSVLFSAAIPQMVRVTNCLVSISCLCVPRMMVREKVYHRRIVLYMLVTATFLAKLLYDVYYNGWYDAVPYQSIFFGGKE